MTYQEQEIIDAIRRLDCGHVIGAILAELERAETKFPQWPRDPVHAAAIVSEESGELIRAALQYEYEKGQFDELQKEATQTGAMACRFLKNMLSHM